jgi:ATP-dependent RNA helicase DeaD
MSSDSTTQDTHPEDIVEPENALPETTLEQLPAPLREAAARAGWTHLMPVQAKAMPYLLAGRDLMIQSRTGSGKTGAFLLPIFDRIHPEGGCCQAIILVPTRELAKQVAGEATMLSGSDRHQATAVYGGVDYAPQIAAFREGVPLVVGTPGRILDHLLRGTLSLDKLKILVFDEADRMLSMGFFPDMKRLQEFLPPHSINGYMFSATFPSRVLRLAGQFLDNPEFLSLSRDRVHVADVEHVFYNVPAMKKDRYLVRIIEVENPTSALIFCNTKANVQYVAAVLKRFGYDADELSSDLSQDAREKVMDRVRRAQLRFLVATDVAARGIDILDLSHVIQYEPPQDAEGYIHRVGRTARAGATGQAFTLVSGLERIELLSIAKRFGIDLLEREPPPREEVQRIVTERVTVLLEARLRDRDRLRAERMQRFVPLARSLGETEDEVSIMAMLLDDYYQQSLHPTPDDEDAPDGGPGRSTSRGGRSPAGARSRGGKPPDRGRSKDGARRGGGGGGKSGDREGGGGSGRRGRRRRGGGRSR